MADKTIRVYPNPKNHHTEYVPGVGPDGADMPIEEAEALLESGAVVKSKPKSDEPAAPAKEKP